VPIIKPAERHKQNTNTVKIHKNKTPKRQNKYNIAVKINIKKCCDENPIP
jgi:hypothetical protein